MGLLRRGKIVGVDIGSAALKVVETAPGRDSLRVTGAGMAPTPAGAVRDGKIVDATAVGTTLRRLLRESRIKTRAAVSGVSGQAAIVRELRLPAMKLDELREAARFEAERYIPYGAQDASLDVHVLGEVTQDGASQLEVLMVATRNEVVQGHLGALEAAGLEPFVLDVEPFALVRSLGNTAGDATVFVHIGAAGTDIVIVEGSRLHLTRSIPVGGEAIVQAVSQALDMSREAAERVLQSGGDAASQSMVDQAIAPILSDIVTEVHRSVDYFRSRSRSSAIGRVILSGGGAALRNVERPFSAELGLPVEVGNPFTKGHVDAGDLDRRLDRAAGPSFAVAVGLALRGADER